MADNIPTPPIPEKKVSGNFLTKVTAGLPNWAWGVVILVGLGIGFYVIKTRKATPSNTTDTSNIVGQTQANNQSGVNATGGFFPTTTVNGQQVPVLPTGYQPINGPGGDTIGFQPVPTSPTQTTINPPFLSVRTRKSQAGTSGPYAQYDAINTGIPVRSDTREQGQILASVPFGTQLQVTGTALTGSPNSPGGSSLWYPVLYNGQQGVVSAEDIANAGSGDIGLNIRQTEGIYR